VSGIDLAEVVAKLECHCRTASIIDAGSPDMSGAPAQWAAIARSGDAEERRLLALSRWCREFVDLIPGYAAALRTKLVDVRVCALSGESLVLLYFFDESDPTYSMTIGWDPASFGAKEPGTRSRHHRICLRAKRSSTTTGDQCGRLRSELDKIMLTGIRPVVIDAG
jgi:hypothetical protein